jgi:hypothetical protein
MSECIFDLFFRNGLHFTEKCRFAYMLEGFNPGLVVC